MKMQWDVDDANVVVVEFNTFFRNKLYVNGREIPVKIHYNKKSEFSFSLDDGRPATLAVEPKLFVRPDILLRVDGDLMAASEKKPLLCPACGKPVKPNDKFCGACGHEMPTAEQRQHGKHVKAATSAIAWLSVLFVLGAVVFYGMADRQADKALANLAGLEASEMYPDEIDGVTYTIGQLRDKIVWEARSVLVVNLGLAVLMALLAWWSRRAPLPAVLIAAATYAAVIVVSAILDPASVAQGWLVKILIITLLARGIKAALALRSEHG
ncbi:MAG TPA: zinc ribbon domain-containing protein [Gallionellaceae bacterium]